MFGVCDSEIKGQSEMLPHDHVTDAPLPRPFYSPIKHTNGSTRLMFQTGCVDSLMSYESDSRACVCVKVCGQFCLWRKESKHV